MPGNAIFQKDQLETSLHHETKLIKEGIIKDDNPLDLSEPFRDLCSACRTGDLKVCQEKIMEGVNINARDPYDYTPLILASLCGHFEVVRLLLESGALCERDTFQGERCLYNALNDRIKNLLLEYDYSKSTDSLQPLAAHVTSLITRDHPVTSDITIAAADEPMYLHKFILAARSPYFRKKLAAAPETSTWRLPCTIPPQAFGTAIKYLYFGEAPRDLRGGSGIGFTESQVFAGIDKISKYLEIENLPQSIIDGGDRRLARQRRTAETARGRDQLEEWFRENVLRHKIVVETSKAGGVKWNRNNSIFADVLLRADELPEGTEERTNESMEESVSARSVLFPCHRAMLLRSEFFNAMFSSTFRETSVAQYLNIIPVDCSPEVLEIVLTFLYTEKADFPLDIAVEVLFAADMLFIEKLKTRAAVVISTLGSEGMSQAEAAKTRGAKEDDLDVYSIIRAAWLTRVQRLEEFAARYLAYRLEAYVDTREFAELIQESAARIHKRQETDSIELLDDIRFYLGERFRLRFDDTGLEIMERDREPKNDDTSMKETGQANSSILPPKIRSDEAREATEEHSVQNGPASECRQQIIKTLDGNIAGDEFSKDAMNYEILMEKLDRVLEKLDLDA